VVVKSAIACPVTHEARWRPMRDSAIKAISTVLRNSLLCNTLVGFGLVGASAGGAGDFGRRGFNRSNTAELRWEVTPDGWAVGAPAPVEARCRIEMPGGYGSAATELDLEIEVVLRRTAAFNQIREQAKAGEVPASWTTDLPAHWKISTAELGALFESLMATLASSELGARVAEMAGVDIAAVGRPRVLHMVTTRSVPEVLELSGLRQIEDAGTSMGAHMLADPVLDLSDASDRREQVGRWLEQVALDAGLEGMESVVTRLGYSRTE
jgi:hypothetical protein